MVAPGLFPPRSPSLRRARSPLRRGWLFAGLAIVSVALAGCDSGGSSSPADGDSGADFVLSMAEQITGSILIVPIQRDLEYDYGFGLYSTILFSRASTERNVQFLEALTQEVPQVKLESLDREERAKKNAFFFPTNIGVMQYCMPDGGDDLFTFLSNKPETRIDFFQVVYGYDTADTWLASLQERGVKYGAGPILVTSPKPVGRITDGDTLVLVLDLSDKSPRLFRNYIDLMLDEIRKPEAWNRGEIDVLSLHAADIAAKFDDTVKGAASAVGNFIRVIRAAQATETPAPTSTEINPAANQACERLKAAVKP